MYGFGAGDALDFSSWYREDGEWTPIRNEAFAAPGVTFEDALFFTDEVGFGTIDPGRSIQRTTDGAESFTQIDLEECNLADVDAAGDHVWSAGGVRRTEEPNGGACLLHSPERGAAESWSLQTLLDEAHDFEGGRLTGVYVASQQEVWAVGRNRQIYHTEDGGDGWTQVEGVPREVGTFEAIDGHGDHLVAAALGEGEVGGQEAMLYESTDGGDSWQLTWGSGDTGASVGGVTMADGFGFAYSEFGDLFRFDGR